jgi:hypothetical protein
MLLLPWRRHLEMPEELRERVLGVPGLAGLPGLPGLPGTAIFCGFSTTLILTTAAPFSATNPEKSGSPVTRAEAGAGDAADGVAAGAAPGPARPTSACEP